MQSYRLTLCVLAFLAIAACKKEAGDDPASRRVTTTINGQLLRKHSRKPVPNSPIVVRGTRPLPACLFCPTSTTDDLASTTTDASGYFSVRIDTTGNYTSMHVGHFVYYRNITPGSAYNGVIVEAYESIILRETFHIYNNAHQPLFVQGPRHFETVKITGRDTSFTVFNTAQPDERMSNSCYYIDSTGKQRTLYLGYSTSDFVDTLQLNFEVDASTF